MKSSRLAWALVVSLVVHLLLFSSGLLPALAPLPETRLRPVSMRLTAMRLDGGGARPKPAAVPALPATGMRVAALPQNRPSRRSDASAATARTPASAPLAAAHGPVAAADASTAAGRAPDDSRYLSAERHAKRFPHRVALRYQVYYGALMAGIATIDWSRDNGHYTLESRVRPIIGPTLRYRSTGSIGADGIRPDDYAAWRNDSPREHAHFDWDSHQLEYGDGDSNRVDLVPGAQDIFSLIFQLALKGAGTPPVQITTGKKVYRYPLEPTGEADFDTGFGKIRALVFRASGDTDQTEFWLAPDFSNQPIRIIRKDANMKLDMRVTDINIDDAAEWHLPKPSSRKHDK